MSPEQLRKMQAGRERWLKQRRQHAIQRVRAFTEWLRAGSPKGSIPEIPSDADYRTARLAHPGAF